MNTDLEIIKGARELISDPANWTQGWYAKRSDGEWTNPTSADACKWCAMGAIQKVVNGGDGECREYYAIVNNGDWFGLFEVNDTHTHAEVLALFDEAIKKLEASHE